MPKISVIIPTYRKNCQEELDNLANYEKYMDTNPFGEEFERLYNSYVKNCEHILNPTIYSLLLQNFPLHEFEVIICHKYPEDFLQGIYSRLECMNLGIFSTCVDIRTIMEKPSIWHSLGDYATVNSNRNTGILNATGELLFFLDDMIIFNENLLQTVWDNYQNGYYTTCKAIKRIKIVDNKIVGKEKLVGEEGTEISDMCTWTYGTSVSLKECLKINGMDEIYDGGFGGTDMDFGRRLSQITRFKRVIGPTIYEFTHYAEQRKRKKIRDDEIFRQICGQAPIPKHIRANTWKPTNEQIEQYKKWHLENIGELDENWSRFMDVPLFDMNLERNRLNV